MIQQERGLGGQSAGGDRTVGPSASATPAGAAEQTGSGNSRKTTSGSTHPSGATACWGRTRWRAVWGVCAAVTSGLLGRYCHDVRKHTDNTVRRRPSGRLGTASKRAFAYDYQAIRL